MEEIEEQHTEQEKPVDLKRHQRYNKKSPLKLLLKAVVILILFYLITYGINVVIEKQTEQQKIQEKNEIDIEVTE